MSHEIQMRMMASGGEITFSFPGVFPVLHFPHAVKAISTYMRSHQKDARKIVFDLSHVDPVENAAGRLLDFVKEYKSKHASLSAEILIPKDVYSNLTSIEYDRLPKPPISVHDYHGVRLVVCEDSFSGEKEAGLPKEEPFEEKVLLACRGKVRTIEKERITLSLFCGEENFLAEFTTSQITNGSSLKVGSIVEYRAFLRSPGVTEVAIRPRARLLLSDDEKIDIYEEIKRLIPDAKNF